MSAPKRIQRPHNFAIDCALKDIEQIEQQGLISPELAQRGRDFVGLVFQDNTVYASVSPIDGEDLCFYWVARDNRLTAILYADENIGWYCANLGSHRTHEGGTPEWFRHALADFTAIVERANPDWHLLRGSTHD